MVGAQAPQIIGLFSVASLEEGRLVCGRRCCWGGGELETVIKSMTGLSILPGEAASAKLIEASWFEASELPVVGLRGEVGGQ